MGGLVGFAQASSRVTTYRRTQTERKNLARKVLIKRLFGRVNVPLKGSAVVKSNTFKRPLIIQVRRMLILAGSVSNHEAVYSLKISFQTWQSLMATCFDINKIAISRRLYPCNN